MAVTKEPDGPPVLPAAMVAAVVNDMNPVVLVHGQPHVMVGDGDGDQLGMNCVSPDSAGLDLAGGLVLDADQDGDGPHVVLAICLSGPRLQALVTRMKPG